MVDHRGEQGNFQDLENWRRRKGLYKKTIDTSAAINPERADCGSSVKRLPKPEIAPRKRQIEDSNITISLFFLGATESPIDTNAKPATNPPIAQEK